MKYSRYCCRSLKNGKVVNLIQWLDKQLSIQGDSVQTFQKDPISHRNHFSDINSSMFWREFQLGLSIWYPCATDLQLGLINRKTNH